jgi:hypothetical protein
MALSGIAPPAACVASNRSLLDQIVHFEGDLLRGEPFCACCGAALAMGIERKPECGDQAHHLGPCRDVRKARPRAKGGLVEIIESVKPRGKNSR